MDWINVRILEQSGRANCSCIALMHEQYCQGRALSGKISAGVYGETLYLIQSTDLAPYSHRELLFSIPERDLLRCGLRPRGAYYRIDWAERLVRIGGSSAALGGLDADVQAAAQAGLQQQLDRFLSDWLPRTSVQRWGRQTALVFGGRN